ncbi:MAG TPA: tetratricopeptide repeat protein [Bryobacteraceae bacterium]|nr:tetratricopeptide repeat protein [Bryobacteraceae bacterium]
MSTSPFPPPSETPRKPSLIPPLILLVLMATLGVAGIRWIRSEVQQTSPILHKTKTGWQHLPSPIGTPEKLRVSTNGTVWLLTWGRTAMSHWDGSRWRYDRETDRGTRTTFHNGNFALDGEQVWMPAEHGVLHWDGKRWNSYNEVAPKQGASIAAGAGEVWIVDDAGKFFHFANGKWTTKDLSLVGKKPSPPDAEEGVAELARTADGTVWLVNDRLWKLAGDVWLPVIAEGKLIDQVTLIGAAGDRLWLSDASGLRAFSKDGSSQSYAADQTGIPDEVTVNDISSAGKLTWFATYSGIFEFDGDHWRQVQRPMERAPGFRTIAASPDGTLWAVGTTPGGVFRNARYFIYAAFLIPMGTLGSLVWLFQRMRGRQMQQHQRVTQAVAHATGTVPAELEIGQRQLSGAGWLWGLQIFGSAIGYYLLRRVWPQAPVWTIPVLFLLLHIAVTFQQSLVKRKPQAWDPIGPGAPSRYDWAKTLKSVGGAVLFILFLNANRIPALHFLRGYTFWLGLVAIGLFKALGVSRMNDALRRADYDGALRIIRWFHFYNPSGSEAMALSGHILLLAGRYREAEQSLRSSFTSSSAGVTYGAALEFLGDALMEQGRYDEAQRCYEAALHSFSWLRRPYRGMTEMLLRQGRYPQKALESVEKILDFAGLSTIQIKNNGKPQDDYWALKAWALASAGQSSQAVLAIDSALAATNPKCLPDLAATHYRAGRAMQALGNLTEAKEHFRKAVEFDPNGRRGTLAKAALHEVTGWRAPEREPEPQPIAHV